MRIKNAVFERSYKDRKDYFNEGLPEIAVVGKSNVGKSSLINKLLNRKQLARVSQMPGKTSTINFFGNDAIDLVDLPGYGYAKVAKSELGRWSEMINGYFDQYRFYALVVSLIDIRHPASKLDEQMIEFLKACELPFVIALTKADKVSKNQANKRIAALRKQLDLGPEVEMILTSSEKGTGMDALRKTILAACR